jgi:O-antigen ligase
VDLSVYLREIPGFTLNHSTLVIWDRSGLNRVSGTATNPIELGVVAGMLLPLAIDLALYDTERSPRMRWTPVALIAIAIPASVSRSGILSVTLALSVLVVLMPPRQRLVALGAVPFALCAVFVSAHGLIGTLTSFFTAGESDTSISARTNDYPLVEKLVQQRPWFGRGGGTWLPENPLDIFDNQYLKVAVELGLVGVVALLALFLVPMVSALMARRRTNDPELRLLCAALAGVCLSAAVCSATFDSFSFPMFPSIFALVIGLIGACTQLAPHSGPATDGHAMRPFIHSQAGMRPASHTSPVQSAGG